MKLGETWYRTTDSEDLCIWCLREAALCVIEDPCGDRESYEDDRT